MPPVPEYNGGDRRHHCHDGGDSDDDDDEMIDMASDVFGNDLGDVDVWRDDGPRPRRKSSNIAKLKGNKRSIVNDAINIIISPTKSPSVPPVSPMPHAVIDQSMSTITRIERAPRSSPVVTMNKVSQQCSSPRRRLSSIRKPKSDGDFSKIDTPVTPGSAAATASPVGVEKKIYSVGTVLPNTPRSRMRRLGLLNSASPNITGNKKTLSSGGAPIAPDLKSSSNQQTKPLSVAEKRRLRNERLSTRASEVEGEKRSQGGGDGGSDDTANMEGNDPFLPLSTRRSPSLPVSSNSSSGNNGIKYVSDDDKPDDMSMSIDTINNASFSSASMMLVSNSTFSLSSGHQQPSDTESRCFDTSMSSFVSRVSTSGVGVMPLPSNLRKPLRGKRGKSIGTVSPMESFSSGDMNESTSNIHQSYSSEAYQLASPSGNYSKGKKKLVLSDERNSSSKLAVISPSLPSSRVARKTITEGTTSYLRDESVPRAGGKIKFARRKIDVANPEEEEEIIEVTSRRSSKSKTSRRTSLSESTTPKSSKKKILDAKPPRSRSSGDVYPAVPSSAHEQQQMRAPSGEGKAVTKTPRSNTPRRKIKYQRATGDSSSEVTDLLNASRDLSIHLEF